MELVPLIPKINSESCADTSHILQEEFQDFLGQNKFQKKIAENLDEFNSQEKILKLCGSGIVESYKDMKICGKDLTHAEKCVMTAQAQGLIQEPKKENVFKLEKIYPSVEKDVVEKYSLIQYEDIMPHITERIINCKMKPEEFIFQNVCLESRKDANKLQAMRCLGKCGPKDVYELKISPSTESTLRKLNNYRLKRKELNKKMKNKYDFRDRQVFKAEPSQIYFTNFEKNVVYEEKFRLRNITSVLQQFSTPVVTPGSCFTVMHTSGNQRLAPGMCATFTVTFKTSEMKDFFEDVIIIPVAGSQNIYIKLISRREVPVVKGLVYCEDDKQFEIETPKERDDIFNYTIDCGSVFYGSTREVKLIITNCGGNGTFFIMSEEDWVSGEINSISEDYSLQLSDFSLTPAYFELKENEVNEIKIIFNPSQYGLCLDKIFLLCDSNTVEEIDVIGDCLYYEPYLIKFEMPDCPYPLFKKSKGPCNVLHLGAIHSMQKVSGNFKVLNTSTLQMCYQWQKNTYTKRKKDFILIEDDHIDINPKEGMFLPASETEFCVTITMGATQFGLYKFEYILYVIDILEQNLSEGPIFNFGHEYINENFEKCLTIQVDQIEVQIHHIALRIQIYPEIINFPTLYYKKTGKEKTVRITNEGYNCFLCEWIVCKDCGCKNDSEKTIYIYPEKFELVENSFVECVFSVTPNTYDDIDEKIILSINNGYSARTLSLQAYVEKPHIQISNSFIDFGVVKRGSTVSTNLIIENHSDVELYWCVHEYRYELKTGQFHETCPCSLDSNCGVLCHRGSGTRLKYTLATNESKRFISILVFCTIFKENIYESCHVILTAHISQPVVSILTENYMENIFDENEEYFVNETIQKSFYIHNDSALEVRYMWHQPEDFDVSFISLSFDKLNGRLYPWSRRHVILSLTLLRVGYVKDFYLLCVEALPNNLELNIFFKIKPPQIEFMLPEPLIYVIWPSYEFAETEIEDENLECYSDEIYNDMQVVNYIPEEKSNSQLQYYPSDLYTYLGNTECLGEISCHYPSECNELHVNTEYILSAPHTPQFLSVFSSNTSICQYYIEFKNLKCRQLYKKTFDITNIMNLPVSFTIKLKNFKHTNLNRKKLDNVLVNLNWIPDDKYTEQLSPYGIFVIVEPEQEKISNKSTISIEIQVYAETWGFYLEEISIELENMPTFYINLIIQIYDFPLEFPIYEKSTENTTNTLKFGNLVICSQPITRSIFLKNTCTIPYKIVWHVFVKNIEDDLKSSINVAYDIFGFNNSVECKIKILSYYGKETSERCNLFKIEPTEIYIQPKEMKSVNVILRPQYFTNDIDNYNIEALLIGHFYIEEQYRHIRNESSFVFRFPERDLLPIKFYLSANIEPGELDLNCVLGEKNIKLQVSEFLKEGRELETEMRFLFRNTNNFPVIMGLKIDKPFEILSIKSANCETTTPDKNDMYTSVVEVDKCAEVLILCKISTKLLMKIADVMYKNTPHFLEDTAISLDNKVKIIKKLYIYQKCNILQELPLSVHLTFPWTEISPQTLTFGEVRLGTEKKLSIRLCNKTTSETWFQSKCDKENIFRIEPSCGYLEPIQPHDHSTLLIVVFAPKDIGYLEDVIIITTCVSYYTQEIKVTGSGTFNEFYFCDLVQSQ